MKINITLTILSPMMDMPHLSWQISCLLKNSLIDFKQLKTHHALRIIIIVNFNQGKPKYVYIMEVLLTYINKIYEADDNIFYPYSTISQEITVNVVNPEWQWVSKHNSNALMRTFYGVFERIFFTSIKVILCKGKSENNII